MDTLLQEIRDPQRRRFEADLAERLEALFRRCTELHGFAVRLDRPVPWHLTCHPTQRGEQAEAVFGEIAQMLIELVEERPEAAELLRGRTFARTVH